MYEQHFGLTKRPFPAMTPTADVFVGPQAAAVVASIEKGLSNEDAVVAVSGPAGVGKTTAVRRALNAVGQNRIVISIGRIPLGHDEIIELLLAGLGATQLPKSTVHRFATFRRLLQQYAEQHKRVLIIVEDAVRVGIDALSELEAVTAEDAGVSDGASIVLMGNEGLRELLREPELARLKQRVRARKSIVPLNANEMLGYLKHGLRVAGGDFDSLFASGSADILYGLSDGIPRVVNNLVKATLSSAAASDQKQVTTDLIERVAGEEFGITVTHSVAEIEQYVDSAKAIADETQQESGVDAAIDEDEQTPEEIVASEEPATATEPEPQPAEQPRAADESGAEPVELSAAIETLVLAEPPDDNNAEPSPEQFADTLPNLETLAPELTRSARETLEALDTGEPLAAEPKRDAESDDDESNSIDESPVLEELPPEEEELPTLFAATETDLRADVTNESEEQPVPEWERDPTLAELRPDLDALERAMATAHGDSESEPAKPEPEPARPEPTQPEQAQSEQAQPEPAAVAEEATPAIPEITLDRQIQEKIEEATEALRQTLTDVIFEDSDAAADLQAMSTPKATPITDAKAGKDSDKDTAELKQIAADLAKAKSIDDVDDRLAETLFGEEFSAIAAAVLAKAQEEMPANDALALQLDEPQDAATPAADLSGSAAARSVQEPDTNKAQINDDSSPAQRLATVRALNGSTAPRRTPPTLEGPEAIVMAIEEPADFPPSSSAQPTPIEDQIETSMTATLKALSISGDSTSDDDDAGETKKRGFLSRFRRS